MFRTQTKLFFRSPLRLILLAVLFGGSLYYYGPMFLAWFQGQVYYAGLGKLQEQLRDFIYVFLLLLFLSFDYFREVPDANINETLKADKNYLKQDLVQALMMILVVLVYAFCFLVMHIACHISDGTYTLQVLFYYFRLTGTYYILDGVVAILAGWLFARNAGKIVGYIVIILFALLISPLAISECAWLSWQYPWIYKVIQIFLIIPQGTQSLDPTYLQEVNWSIAARGIFWIGLFGTLLFLSYYRQEKRKYQKWIMLLGVICTIVAAVYSELPVSYYCVDNFISDTDDIFRYQMFGIKQQEKDADFKINFYDMEIQLGRQMKAKVICSPSVQTLDRYDMTLYYAYQIDRVTDENGEALMYQRDESTLTIYGQPDGIEKICIEYHGGSPKGKIHANRNEMYLPGWFPYYPIAGWQKIYDTDKNMYVDNQLKEPADFRIQIKTSKTVYSDLEEVAENRFCGKSEGPTLLMGFVKETELENGVRYIYPYASVENVPDTKFCVEEQKHFLNTLENTNSKIRLFMITPNVDEGGPGIYREDQIIDSVTFAYLNSIYEESGQWNWEMRNNETDEEDRIETVKMLYYNFKENESGETLYENVRNMYLTQMQEFGYTEDDFEEFVIKNLGQEEWDYLNNGGV